MKRYLFLILTLLLLGQKGFALDVVYPKKNPCTINASSTFFIGSVNPNEILTINDTEVQLSSMGAFAQVVPLKLGSNNFILKSGEDKIDFIINRPLPIVVTLPPPMLAEFPILNNFYVKTDNTPLRMTPVNSGINRMASLPLDTKLLVNGEKGEFYRIYLNSKLSGWVAKSDVEQRDVPNSNDFVKLKGLKIREEKGFCVYEFEVEGKIPFILKEENGLTLQLFNIDEQIDNTYSLNIPQSKLFGYNATYDNGKFILKIRKNPSINQERPLKDIIIAVDAGHGGCENGAIGACGDKEKDINLSIAKNLQQELEKRGAKVVMTRDNDVQVSLQDRVNIAMNKNATLLISVHANALPDGSDPLKNRGTSVYYYHNQAKSLAEEILSSITTQVGTQNDNVRQGSLALVRPTSCVSVLIEVAYIINPDDYALLINQDFQVNCAKAIADGIEKYILK